MIKEINNKYFEIYEYFKEIKNNYLKRNVNKIMNYINNMLKKVIEKNNKRKSDITIRYKINQKEEKN